MLTAGLLFSNDVCAVVFTPALYRALRSIDRLDTAFIFTDYYLLFNWLLPCVDGWVPDEKPCAFDAYECSFSSSSSFNISCLYLSLFAISFLLIRFCGWRAAFIFSDKLMSRPSRVMSIIWSSFLFKSRESSRASSFKSWLASISMHSGALIGMGNLT